MIFGIEYKTLPSFLGFIRPMKKLSLVSFGIAAMSVAVGVLSIIYSSFALSGIFNILLFSCAIMFAISLHIFGGFDNSGILSLIEGEKKARYTYTILHSRLAFFFLYAGVVTSAVFNLIANNFLLYDLAIHYTAIGFMGITIALYLPLMLPPITGKSVHFAKFNSIPILLVLIALAVRTISDLMTTSKQASDANYIFMLSGWLIVSSLIAYVTMIHRSMSKIDSQVIDN
jgi:hypothetical protein